jgi:hypothetical protein
MWNTDLFSMAWWRVNEPRGQMMERWPRVSAVNVLVEGW